MLEQIYQPRAPAVQHYTITLQHLIAFHINSSHQVCNS